LLSIALHWPELLPGLGASPSQVLLQAHIKQVEVLFYNTAVRWYIGGIRRTREVLFSLKKQDYYS